MGLFSQTYGRFEVRAQVPAPAIKGLQETFWLWPDNDTRYGSWPGSGEIDFDRFPVGSRLKILPNHACATAAAYDRYFVTDDGEHIIATWDRVNGW